MPLYEYACRSCAKTFCELKSVSERAKPTESPCSDCNGEVYLKIGKVGSIDNTGKLQTKKVPGDFKNLVQDIYKAHNRKYEG